MYQNSFKPASKSRKRGSFSSNNQFKSKGNFASYENQFGSSNTKKSQGSFVPFGSAKRSGNSFTSPGFKKNWSNKGFKNGRRPNDYSRYISAGSAFAGQEEYICKNSFSDFNIADLLKENIKNNGYITPTPIQDQAIPLALLGKDVIGIADTGTGKTAAFVLPLINKMIADPSQKALIIAPTRELASQIDTEIFKFTKGMKIFSVQVIGGAHMGRQINALTRNPRFVVGTPGRLNDLIRRRKLNLSSFSNIVLDEVDRMVDMGFIDDIRTILSQLPENRQSLFFSATVPPKVSSLVKSFLKDPVTVSVKTSDTSKNVKQDIVKIGMGQKKIEVLHELLIKEEFKKVLIFGKTKKSVDLLAIDLEARGFKATSIHGDKPQSKREKALRLFKKDALNILVATDVAARGLDISGVTHVINYDLPENYEDYIHRIGRTGRANNLGCALTFVN
jgi:ATP-dependent RNA helicase RhlE